MSGIGDLVAIYRAIDEAVAADSSGRSRDIAARFIPQYHDERAVGWTEQLDRLFAAPGVERPTPVGPSLTGALAHVAVDPPDGRLQSRTLLPLAVLGRLRAVTDQDDESSAALARAISAFQPPSADLPDDALVRLLLDDDHLPDVAAWPRFTQRAADAGLLVRSAALQSPPCFGTLVSEEVEHGDEDPVTRMETLVCGPGITDEEVRAFLDPTTWARCSPLYCEMRDEGPSADGKGHCYVEVLSPDCADPTLEKIVVCLVFELQQKGDDCFILEYWMCPDQPAGSGKVVVDHGTILVERNADGWCFNTTKYLRFAGVANGAVLSLVACALGYATFAEDFLHCAQRPDPGPHEPPVADWDPYLPPGEEPVVEPDAGGGGDPGWDA